MQHRRVLHWLMSRVRRRRMKLRRRLEMMGHGWGMSEMRILSWSRRGLTHVHRRVVGQVCEAILRRRSGTMLVRSKIGAHATKMVSRGRPREDLRGSLRLRRVWLRGAAMRSESHAIGDGRRSRGSLIDMLKAGLGLNGRRNSGMGSTSRGNILGSGSRLVVVVVVGVALTREVLGALMFMRRATLRRSISIYVFVTRPKVHTYW